jgi:phosphomevalonate kinase
MRIEEHVRKAKSFENTIKKLDLEEDYETVVEDCILATSHYVNAAMHKIGSLRIDKDIKHTRLPSELRENRGLRGKSEEVAKLVEELENLRPSHIYGKGRNGETAKRALDVYEKIKKICHGVLK